MDANVSLTGNFSNISDMWSADSNGNFSLDNATVFTNIKPLSQWRQALFLVLKYGSIVNVGVVMISVGCSISLQRILLHLKRPWGILIGIACQFVLLPAIAFATAHALSLPAVMSIGLLVIATCPGGPMSNLFSIWCDGDVSLR